jgi:putative peptidoglycan lipid II flippase
LQALATSTRRVTTRRRIPTRFRWPSTATPRPAGERCDNPELGGIKRGVGLVVDLGTPEPVRSVVLRLSGNGTSVEIRVPEGDAAAVATPPMGSDRRWRTVASQDSAGSSATLTLAKPVTTRYVLVYLTSLPKDGSGYRGGIYEAEILT